jgi:hypothetical protein
MDTPTLSNEFQKLFSEDWKSAEFRCRVVPGKAVFSLLAKFTQDQFNRHSPNGLPLDGKLV